MTYTVVNACSFFFFLVVFESAFTLVFFMCGSTHIKCFVLFKYLVRLVTSIRLAFADLTERGCREGMMWKFRLDSYVRRASRSGGVAGGAWGRGSLTNLWSALQPSFTLSHSYLFF